MALQLAQIYVDIGARLGGLFTGLNRAYAAVTRFGTTIAVAGLGLMRAGLMLALPFIAATKSAMSFEDQMSKVSTMLDSWNMRYMPRFTKGVQDLAVEFGLTTKELTDGLFAILSAQIPAADAFDFLTAAAKMTVAGITDTDTAVKGLTKLMFGYGLSVKDVGDAADFMFAVFKMGQGTFDDFAKALPMATARAGLGGLRMEEFGAAVATASRVLQCEANDVCFECCFIPIFKV